MTGFLPRSTSVITATTEVVISEKSIEEFFSVEFSAMEVSRISMMRIRVLFNPQLRVAHDLAPLLDLELDPLSEFIRRVGDRHEAEVRELLLHVRLCHRLGDLLLQQID